MKVVILAGGIGSRLFEETKDKPKPMIEIGDRPLLWHIMKFYAYHGFKDFIIALGYKGGVIQEQLGKHYATDWKVELVDTGVETLTGGRIKRIAPYITETFMLTWGDGVSDIDLSALLRFHRTHGKLATVTAVKPLMRFGHMILKGDQVTQFSEKAPLEEEWINGAFFVLEPDVLNYIEGNFTQWEEEPLQTLMREGQLMAYKHTGFWQCMDTLHEKRLLEDLWQKGAPWKVWN
ncbi:glucose-1-phosphate cytidylyltransferase [Thermodesulfobacteriota bacterium]